MKPARPPGTASRRPAFTLVELLVAMSITVVLVAMVIQITGNVLGIWTKTTGTLETENQAALIFDLLAKDLRGAVMKRDGRVWLAATIQGDQAGAGDAGITLTSATGATGATVENWPASGGKPGQASAGTPPSSLNLPTYTPPTSATATLTSGNMVSLNSPSAVAPSSYRFGQAGVWLRFFTTQADNALPANATVGPPNEQNDSVPRAVAYQIARIQLTATGGYHYFLFRSTVRPYASAVDAPSGSVSNVAKSQQLSTFNSGYDVFYQFIGGVHTTTAAPYNVPATGGTNLGDAGNIRRPNLQQLLGNNVVDFGIRFWGLAYDANHNQMPVLLFPVSNTNLGFAASTEDGFTRTKDPSNNPINATIPPTNFTGNTASMTYAFAYRKNGGTGTPDTPCTPAFCDVFLRILDDDGTRLINLIEAGQLQAPNGITPANFWWQTAEQHSQIYTRRIELFASPM
jgi:prepilin-type N-terminal cleavage/methylation domain-containing protein